MGARLVLAAANLTFLALVASCAGDPYSEPRARWRAEAERACLASGAVRSSPYVQPMSSLDGRGSCGLERPLRVSAASHGRVAIEPPAILGCPVTAAIDRWVERSVQPAARAYFGTHVVAIRQIASYGCRTRNNHRRARLSEHAFGNALDVSGFRFADGRDISITAGWWRGGPRERGFLMHVFSGACAEFYTALGPGSDRYHADHFHLDLLLTNARNGRHFCQPQPQAPGAFASAPRRESALENSGTVAGTPLTFTGTAQRSF